MDSMEAEIIEFFPTIEMLLGKGKKCGFCFGFDQHILIMFSKKADSLKERARFLAKSLGFSFLQSLAKTEQEEQGEGGGTETTEL